MSAIIWLTGLPGAGKTTIALALQERLQALGYKSQVLDGDEFREKIPGIGFSKEARLRHVQYAGLTAAYLAKNSVFAICAFVSPHEEARQKIRQFHDKFFEVWLNTPKEICEERDPKGHYLKARQGQIEMFTGISDPYEVPTKPELIIDTSIVSIDAAVNLILSTIFSKARFHEQPTTNA